MYKCIFFNIFSNIQAMRPLSNASLWKNVLEVGNMAKILYPGISNLISW